MDRPRSPVVDRRTLSARLRSLRERAELSLDEAASAALDASGAKLSRIETGKQVAGPRDVRDLCRLYGIDEAGTAELVALATSARESGWWESYDVNDDDYVGLEAGATHLQQFENSVVPGLLQTRAYAQAYLGNIVNQGRLTPWTKSEIQQQTKMQETRQEILRPDSEKRFSFVLDEALLLRAVSGRQMRAQIEHIKKLSAYPNVNIRILPLSLGANPGQQGGFTLLTLPEEAADVAYIETLAGFFVLDSTEEVTKLKRLYDVIRNSCPDESNTEDALDRIAEQLPPDKVASGAPR